ncbi:MAG: hypothetical protein COZ46_06880 [Verrucomicrobia bacterium CG_4_10_14_3_um_filter_43_23]|nr:MAG: hypothetical protein AUJ82_05100 [Verrucomicrobia bacterium CG1_02_43_26]PIP59814.1 MAG: hypothetical protein COX01_01485 [Verrucomicrobia bacterium CG22_combo_CG10-13_8_21_14_all_43_17]PIX57826.1 MAG: hypothetical protein COZ46_06880 [Verrucomicrobia bacterium CG_4_10_14_3_um_filter_43_23]PIY63031.1 MAG: hypothetical protein COY94_00425 [Verrucomicrobia bacterium CG_4_10_14_0_8_um_filter_43_34]PJA43721.1 MAG: hypothetical protein CO175_06740 [Verrucomicrobia bacterium CG_4_9_14_3_um_fi
MNYINSTEKINKKDKELRRTFALRFRVLMAYHDVALHDIAKAVGYPISTIGTWRNGRIPSSPEAIHKLADFFRVTPEFLLLGRVKHDESQAAMEVVNQIRVLLSELDDHTVIKDMLKLERPAAVNEDAQEDDLVAQSV